MKKRIVIAVAAVAVLLGGVYLWGPSSAPAGQKPLTELSGANWSDFVAAFDMDSDAARVVLLLSPT